MVLLRHHLSSFFALTLTTSIFPVQTAGSPLLAQIRSKFSRDTCGSPCGYYGQLCCASDETCYTDSNGQAQCGAGGSGSGGYWSAFTTTYVRTDLSTVTSTGSSHYGAAAAATPTVPQCDSSKQQSSCGTVCCSSSEYCSVPGTCLPANGGLSASLAASWSSMMSAKTAAATQTQVFAPPFRPTAAGTDDVVTKTIITATITPTITVSTRTATTLPSTTQRQTSTVPFIPPVATGANVTVGALAQQNPTTSTHKLSGGAIAGIVIGVLLAIAILLLICFCCCVRGIWHGVAALFGFGKKDDRRRGGEREVAYIEEEYHRRGSRRDDESWYGNGNGGPVVAPIPPPSRRDDRDSRRWQQEDSRRHSSSGGNNNGKSFVKEAAGVGGVLAALAVGLGLKRRHDKKEYEKQHRASRSYRGVAESDLTSESSLSSYQPPRRQSRSRGGPPMRELSRRPN